MPLVETVIEEMGAEAVEFDLDAEELQDSVKDAVKHAVKAAVKEAITPEAVTAEK